MNMKVGMIIYSRTGNTLSVAEKLKASLLDAGHTVCLARVTAVNEDPNAKGPVRLINAPGILGYDHVIFGAPVQAFSLSPIMKAYLAQLAKMDGIKTTCFVTQHFPKAWMGGRQAIKHMLNRIGERGGIVTETGIVNWTNKEREQQIAEVVSALGTISG